MSEQPVASAEAVNVEPLNDVPIEDDEYILRALSTEDVDKTKRVRWRAVAPRQMEESTSVMRLRLLGSDKAKLKALEIKGEKFCGFGRARAETFRRFAPDVADSREHFHGHADLEHGFPRPPADTNPPPPGSPAPSTDAYRQAVNHYRGIANMLCLFEDTPSPAPWSGADLEAACTTEGCQSACTHPASA